MKNKPINLTATSLKLSRNALVAGKIIKEIRTTDPKVADIFLKTYIRFLKEHSK